MGGESIDDKMLSPISAMVSGKKSTNGRHILPQADKHHGLCKSPFKQLRDGFGGMMNFDSNSPGCVQANNIFVPRRLYRTSPSGEAAIMTPRALVSSLREQEKRLLRSEELDSVENMSFNSLKSAEKTQGCDRSEQLNGDGGSFLDSEEKPSQQLMRFHQKTFKKCLLFSERESPVDKASILLQERKSQASPSGETPQTKVEQLPRPKIEVRVNRSISDVGEGTVNNMKNQMENEIARLACESVISRIQRENPGAYGRLILKRPKFIVQLRDEYEMDEMKENISLQEQIQEKLLFAERGVIADFQKCELRKQTAIANAASQPHSFHCQRNGGGGQEGRGEFMQPRARKSSVFFETRNEVAGNSEQSGQRREQLQDKAVKGDQVHSTAAPIVSVEKKQEDEELEEDLEGHMRSTETKTQKRPQSQQQQQSEQLNRKRKHCTEMSSPNEHTNEYLTTPSTKKKVKSQGPRTEISRGIISTRQQFTQPFIYYEDNEEEEEDEQLKNKAKKNIKADEEEEEEEFQYGKSIIANVPSQTAVNEYTSRKECCGCKKTKCLKLYCECFQAKRHCTNCNCNGCKNKPEFEDVRKQAMDSIQMRNSSAFEPKVEKSGEEAQESANSLKIHSKGCNCKKSDCRKKYCECFQMGARCTHLCKCVNCKNRHDYDVPYSGGGGGIGKHLPMQMPLHPIFYQPSQRQHLDSHAMLHGGNYSKGEKQPLYYFGAHHAPQSSSQMRQPLYPNSSATAASGDPWASYYNHHTPHHIPHRMTPASATAPTSVGSNGSETTPPVLNHQDEYSLEVETPFISTN